MRAAIVTIGCLVTIASLLAVGSATAQPTPRATGVAAATRNSWTELLPTRMPTPRDSVQMAYDPLLHEVVLFGGYAPTIKPLGDTWVFKSGQWRDITKSLVAAPPARWNGGFAYDPQLGALVLFGGRNLDKEFQDTWCFNATGWHLISTSSEPSPRNEIAMAWDPLDHYLLLYGGSSGDNPLGRGKPSKFYNDTWEFSGGNWHQLANSPMGARARTQMVYDPADGYMLLMGGTRHVATTSVIMKDTWSYVNGTWTKLKPVGSPTLLAATGTLAWDPAIDAAVLFGGYLGSTGVYGNATWTYRSDAWTNLTATIPTSPPVRVACGMAFDSASDQLLMFGGSTPAPNYSYYNDLWAFE